MSKAEEYLSERLEALSEEKVIIITKINEIELEIEEIEGKISELKSEIDESFEVFSPRSRKNDFVKSEIVNCEERIESLRELLQKYQQQAKMVSEDIHLITEALGEIVIDDKSTDVLEADETDVKDTCNIINGIDIIFQQENERKRLSMELHDSTVQILTNLVHKCELCSRFMDMDTVRAKMEIEVMRETLKVSIDELRRIIYNLRPMSFDDIGIETAIEKFINQEKMDTNIEMSFEVEGETRILEEVLSITVLRVIQEYLRNSKKFSNATHMEIVLRYLPDGVSIDINDDGSGIDIKNLKRPENNDFEGFGLLMIKEKVSLLNGSFNIITGIDKGTKIEVFLPDIKKG